MHAGLPEDSSGAGECGFQLFVSFPLQPLPWHLAVWYRDEVVSVVAYKTGQRLECFMTRLDLFLPLRHTQSGKVIL